MPTSLPAHERVKIELRRRLRSQWKPGVRLPPIAMLARQLGAGHNNTHRAVRELAREGLFESRPGFGTLVAPVRPVGGEGGAAWADVLRGRVVQVVYITDEPFVRRVGESLSRALGHWRCEFRERRWDPEDPRLFPRTFDERADAVVLVNPNPAPPIVCHPHQVLVVINTALETPVGMPGRYDVISADSEQGGFIAGRWLAELGCKSVCYIGVRGDSARYDQTSSARLRGLEHGLGARLPAAHQLVVRNYVVDKGAGAIKAYLSLKPRPDAIFAASDELAVGLVYGAIAHGLEVGKDFRLVGFDGQERGRTVSGGPLTTVEAPMDRMGSLAARMLAERLADPDQPVRRLSLGCSLYQGATARCR